MSKKGNIVSRMLAIFAKDEDTTPEDLKEAMDAVNEPEEKPEVKDEDVPEEEVKKHLMQLSRRSRSALPIWKRA